MAELHETTQQLFALLAAQNRILAPNLQAAVEQLSPTHPSGIGAAQLDTPMMKQFIAAKNEAPDALVFFRMGDFFETFGADAIIVSELCGLQLTSRNKNSENSVPMAGVPVGTYRVALRKCVHAGFKVAICDQVEDPRQAKSIVKREIVRIATPAVPGDLGDEDTESQLGCFLASVSETHGLWTLSFVDVSTGEFRITGGLERELFVQELLTVSPKEVLCPADKMSEISKILRECFQTAPRVSQIENWIFRSEKESQALFSEFFEKNDFFRFGISQWEKGLEVVVALLSYLKQTQKNILQNIKNISSYEKTTSLFLDDSTKRHLDFFQTASGERKGSLFWFLNRCCTAAGARLLVRRMNYPFNSCQDIHAHLQCVEEIVKNPGLESQCAENLKKTTDIEKLVSRAAQGDFDARRGVLLSQSLQAVPETLAILKAAPTPVPGLLGLLNCELALESSRSLAEFLELALEPDPSPTLGKGQRTFREGFSSELDTVISLQTNFEGLIEDLEKREREKTQIPTLKIGYNRVAGYFFEITRSKLGNTPAHFIRKQTLTAGGERFITAELKELEDKALTANEERLSLEKELLEKVRLRILESVEPLLEIAKALGQLDLFRNFAFLASNFGWCKPNISEANVTALKNSVHPVLKLYQSHGESFVSNSIVVGEAEALKKITFEKSVGATKPDILLITGPNMAGKSTIMRQLAVAQILFQMGSYVPASEAEMGACDKIFTRIGSSDNALKNQSTFMVEMLESAQMLRSATAKSLLLMDELGRGTSTFDGLSIAWAILEDIHDRLGARTLFSTHYHELQAIVLDRPRIVPMQMEVIEQDILSDAGSQKSILFSRRFLRGAAEKSYGIHVAELAGHRKQLIDRAAEILEGLSAKGISVQPPSSESGISVGELTTKFADEIRLLEKEQADVTRKREDLKQLFRDLDLNSMTPFEALTLLNDLKSSMESQDSVRQTPRTRSNVDKQKAPKSNKNGSNSSAQSMISTLFDL